jgi:hypothetical protein
MEPHLKALMTLSKGASSSGLQVQSVVARVNFPHEGTHGLISNSRGTVKKAPLVLLQATCKTISLSCVLVDGFRVTRIWGTTRRTQGFERRGLNV